MEFHIEGEWMVGSPVYVGDSESVLRMAECSHEKWQEQSKSEANGYSMIMEKCSCGATRGRYKILEDS